jgi:hypothetical protein
MLTHENLVFRGQSRLIATRHQTRRMESFVVVAQSECEMMSRTLQLRRARESSPLRIRRLIAVAKIRHRNVLAAAWREVVESSEAFIDMSHYLDHAQIVLEADLAAATMNCVLEGVK